MKLKFPYSLLLGVACVFLTQSFVSEPVISTTSNAVGVDVVVTVPNTVVNIQHLPKCLMVLIASW